MTLTVGLLKNMLRHFSFIPSLLKSFSQWKDIKICQMDFLWQLKLPRGLFFHCIINVVYDMIVSNNLLKYLVLYAKITKTV